MRERLKTYVAAVGVWDDEAGEIKAEIYFVMAESDEDAVSKADHKFVTDYPQWTPSGSLLRAITVAEIGVKNGVPSSWTTDTIQPK